MTNTNIISLVSAFAARIGAVAQLIAALTGPPQAASSPWRGTILD